MIYFMALHLHRVAFHLKQYNCNLYCSLITCSMIKTTLDYNFNVR